MVLVECFGHFPGALVLLALDIFRDSERDQGIIVIGRCCSEQYHHEVYVASLQLHNIFPEIMRIRIPVS